MLKSVPVLSVLVFKIKDHKSCIFIRTNCTDYFRQSVFGGFSFRPCFKTIFFFNANNFCIRIHFKISQLIASYLLFCVSMHVCGLHRSTHACLHAYVCVCFIISHRTVGHSKRICHSQLSWPDCELNAFLGTFFFSIPL